ncbi:MAG: leucine-rich repeat protein [Oscillospiraceae bacterium]|nr:leucine-rich repeat protein [Oscillospiraceae bacterium]
MKTKHLTALLLASCICLTAVPAAAPGYAITAKAEESGDFSYTVLEDGTAEISKYNGSDETVEIPAQIDGKAVTSIGYGAFAECTGLDSVTIPEGVTKIDNFAFYRSSLTSVTIPESVDSIGGGAFQSCNNLTSVIIPEGVTVIENNVFTSCTSLTSVAIPPSVTGIGFEAFMNCTSLTYVAIPDGVNTIRFSAFKGCTSLTSPIIATTVTDIEAGAFEDTPCLQAWRENNPLVVINGILIDAENCSGDVVIPQGVTCIGPYVFKNHTDLTSVTIPESVTSIGEGAFNGCENYTISGYEGTYAQTYATTWEIPFVSLGEAPESPRTGDIDGNGTIGADDASMVLVAAAALGLDAPSGLDADAEKRADVDGDGNVNSVDASIILTYAAAQGLSEEPLDLMDFVPKK